MKAAANFSTLAIERHGRNHMRAAPANAATPTHNHGLRIRVPVDIEAEELERRSLRIQSGSVPDRTACNTVRLDPITETHFNKLAAFRTLACCCSAAIACCLFRLSLRQARESFSLSSEFKPNRLP